MVRPSGGSEAASRRTSTCCTRRRPARLARFGCMSGPRAVPLRHPAKATLHCALRLGARGDRWMAKYDFRPLAGSRRQGCATALALPGGPGRQLRRLPAQLRRLPGPRLTVPSPRSQVPPRGSGQRPEEASAPQSCPCLVAGASGQLGRRLLCQPGGSGAVFWPPARLGPWPSAYALLPEKTRVSQSVGARVRT